MDMEWPRITIKTPIEEVKKIHQRIWDYAIEHGEKPITPYLADCVACAYDALYENDCKDCPIIWPKNEYEQTGCCGSNGLHTRWLFADGEEKTELARQIRDLPWKFEQESES